MSLRRFRALVWKELLELSRDSIVILFVIYAFTGDIFTAAQGFHLELTNAAMSVIDYDHSAASRELVARFAAPYFSLRKTPASEREMLKRLDSGADLLGIVIPHGFQSDLEHGQHAAIQLFLDGSRATHASLAEGYAREIIGGLGSEMSMRRIGLTALDQNRMPMVEAALRVRFNPNRREEFFNGINEMLIMLSVLAIALPASALIREREHGTIEQLLVSPIEPWELLLAKIAASTVVLIFGALLATFCLLIPFFHVPVRGSLGLFFACAAIFVFTMAGLGLVVASFCRTMPQVSMMTLIVMAPIIFLSGAWTPPEAMPGWLAEATVLSPLRWFNEIAFGIFLRGASLGDLQRPLTMMIVLGAVFFAWGATQFRRHFR
ncbi:MAG TPA: ABC transporter permease [Candidatus Binataceae bacterium]|nr:ABC transporter permease [Candidatus Binataceae bacterium]